MSQPSPAPDKKAGYYQRAKDKTAARAAPVIAAALGPSERILAGARVESGLSQWWLFVSTWLVLLKKYYYMALTEHHLVLCRLSKWTGRPTRVESAIPRDQVRAGDYKPGVVFGTFMFLFPGRTKPSRVRVHRIFRPEIESILGQLGVLGPAPGQGPVYGPGPGARPRRAARRTRLRPSRRATARPAVPAAVRPAARTGVRAGVRPAVRPAAGPARPAVTAVSRPATPRRAACGCRPAVPAAPWSGRPPA